MLDSKFLRKVQTKYVSVTFAYIMSFHIMKLKSVIMQTYASSRECRRDIFINMVATDMVPCEESQFTSFRVVEENWLCSQGIDFVARCARFNIYSSPQAPRTVHKGNIHPACRDLNSIWGISASGKYEHNKILIRAR